MTSTLIDPRAFALIDDELDGRPVLAVVGELDLFTGPELRRRALERVEAGGGDLVLDLTACPFVDSAGCAALLAVTRGVRARGGRLILAGPTAGPAQVFEMMGLADLIPIVDELDDIAALPR